MFEARISAEATETLPKRYLHGPVAWKVMQRNAWKDIASWPTKQLSNRTKSQLHAFMTINSKKKQQLYNVSTPCIDDHHFKEEDMKSVGELSKVCSQFLLKFLYLARIGAVTKWTKTCDKRLARLIAYIHHTCEHRQYCYVENTAQHCRLELFQDSDFAGDLEDSKSTSRGIPCIVGSQTFVPIRWMCKKQTSVSHSSTDAKVISLDAG